MSYNDLHYPGFLTNISAELADCMRQAAEETGTEIKIQDKAFTANGRPLSGYVAVILVKRDEFDLTPFWKRFEQLVAAALEEPANA